MPIPEVVRRYLDQPLVRPWALFAPVLVLVLCVPLLRPLRQPDAAQLGERERGSLAMVQSMVEGHTLRIDRTIFARTPAQFRGPDGGAYANVPPMQAALAAPVYWAMRKWGLNFAGDQVMVRYLLVLLCVTLPLALSAGLVYRLGRLFELARPVRVGMALLVTLPTGMLVYAVSFAPHAQAAVLLLAAVTCISHVAVSRAPRKSIGWLVVAGAFAALAACLHQSALLLLVLLPVVVIWMRWSSRMRLGGVLLYALGALAILGVNSWLLFQMTQELHILPPSQVAPAAGLSAATHLAVVRGEAATRPRPEMIDEDDGEQGVVERFWTPTAAWIGRVLNGVLGEEGILSHYPAIALGVLGASLALRRHWAETTKAMAGVTLLAAAILLAGNWIWSDVGTRDVYGPGWIAPVLPLVMLWCGAWLRPGHRGQSWILAGAACALSLAIVLAGMLDLPPASGYHGYSFAEAVLRMAGK